MDKLLIWQHAKPYIIKDINSEVSYNTYLKDANIVSFENSVFTIAVTLPIKGHQEYRDSAEPPT